MNETHTEIEVKLLVPELHVIAVRLEKLGAELVAPRIFERNVRFENADQTLTDAGIVVRLRQDARVRLTVKEPPSRLTASGLSIRFEAEVEVSDFDTMVLILGKLGYQPHMVYEKYRTTYTMDGAEVVLDEMPYGNFVEIEGDDSSIGSTLQALNLTDAPRLDANYVALFERVRLHMGLAFSDLTFGNFADIKVPISALLDRA